VLVCLSSSRMADVDVPTRAPSILGTLIFFMVLSTVVVGLRLVSVHYFTHSFWLSVGFLGADFLTGRGRTQNILQSVCAESVWRGGLADYRCCRMSTPSAHSPRKRYRRILTDVVLLDRELWLRDNSGPLAERRLRKTPQRCPFSKL